MTFSAKVYIRFPDLFLLLSAFRNCMFLSFSLVFLLLRTCSPISSESRVTLFNTYSISPCFHPCIPVITFISIFSGRLRLHTLLLSWRRVVLINRQQSYIVWRFPITDASRLRISWRFTKSFLTCTYYL